jgi:low affinity Fe/Cu permease
MTLDIVMAVVMCAALLWWIGRSLSARSMLLATAVTLTVIAAVMLVQNHWPR